MHVEGLAPELRILIDRDHIQEGPLYARLPVPAVTDDERQQLIACGWTLRPYRDRPVLEPPEATFTWDRHLVLFRDNMRHAAAHRLPGGLPVAGPKEAILDEVIASIWEERVEELRTVLSAFSFASAWRCPEQQAAAAGTLVGSFSAAEEALLAGVQDGDGSSLVPGEDSARDAGGERGRHDPPDVDGVEPSDRRGTESADALEPADPGQDSGRAPGDHGNRMEGTEVFFFYTQSMRRAAVEALTETMRSPADDDPVWELVESLR